MFAQHKLRPGLKILGGLALQIPLCLLSKPVLAGTYMPQVTLPIEVVSYGGIAASAVSAEVPASVDTSPITSMTMTINNLEYPGEVGVQVLGNSMVTLSNSTCKLSGPTSIYGGIGGQVTTLTVTIPVTPGTVVSGGKAVCIFRLLKPDPNGRCNTFRVIGFNFQRADGSNALPATEFRWDNPALWTPPLNDPTDIAAGKQLFTTATLDIPFTHTAMKAHCSDCHASDGRDLKYFNYDNRSIIGRSVFHGLTVQQGEQIASYIRSLPASEGSINGRPWNPVFQPGPGLSKAPLQEWAAGAGLSAVLNSDSQMLPYLFPNGITQAAVQSMITQGPTQIDPRNIPTSLPLLVWDQWLPGTGPQDIIPASVLTPFLTRLNGYYDPIVFNPATPHSQLGPLAGAEDINFINMLVSQGMNTPSANYTPALAQKEYAMQQWWDVRGWETFQTLIGIRTDMDKHWLDNRLFNSSPFRGFIPIGMLTGSQLSDEYLSNAWYAEQLVTNCGDNHAGGNAPIDYAYFYGHMANLQRFGGILQPLRMTEAMLLGMRNYNGPNMGIYVWYGGFRPWHEGLMLTMVEPAWTPQWSALPASTTASILNAMAGAYLQGIQRFTPTQYYDGGVTSPTQTPGYVYSNWVSGTYETIPVLQKMGVSATITNGLADWAQQVWKTTNWQVFKTAQVVN